MLRGTALLWDDPCAPYKLGHLFVPDRPNCRTWGFSTAVNWSPANTAWQLSACLTSTANCSTSNAACRLSRTAYGSPMLLTPLVYCCQHAPQAPPTGQLPIGVVNWPIRPSAGPRNHVLLVCPTGTANWQLASSTGHPRRTAWQLSPANSLCQLANSVAVAAPEACASRAVAAIAHRTRPLQAPGAAEPVMGVCGNKSRQGRADAQRLVATRLLERLHDPLGHFSRLQRIYPRAR